MPDDILNALKRELEQLQLECRLKQINLSYLPLNSTERRSLLDEIIQIRFRYLALQERLIELIASNSNRNKMLIEGFLMHSSHPNSAR